MNYSFSDLILIVGTNPVPNFVVADYFIDKNPELQKIWFVVSEKSEKHRQSATEKFAVNIIALLQRKYSDKQIDYDYSHKIKNLGSDKSISDEMKRLCKTIEKQQSAEVHLNYTGGTKSMAIHAYVTARDCFQERINFSYLDPRTDKLCFDCNDCGYKDIDRMRDKVHLDLKDLIFLHNFELFSNLNRDFSKYEETMKNLHEMLEKDELSKFYEKNPNSQTTGYDRVLFEDAQGNLAKYVDPSKVGKNKEYLSKENLDNLQKLQPNFHFAKVNNSLPENREFFRKNSEGKYDFNPGAENFYDTLLFLDGRWLEEYVAEKLRKMKQDGDLPEKIQIETNYEIKNPSWSGQNAKFEIDILIIKGFQLFGISITTSNSKKLCKSKGFEIIHRAQQIGGEEAKTMLITLMASGNQETQAGYLEDELSRETGSRELIRVLGRDDLKTGVFETKLMEFIGGA